MAKLSTSYYTDYDVEGAFEYNQIGYRNHACFAEAFRALDRFRTSKKVHCKYTIRVYKVAGNNLRVREGNATFLTKDELFRFVSSAKKYFNFKCNVNEYDDRYDVIIDINNTSVCHKYILTWVRYTYEYPFNICCLDTVELRNTGKYDYISTQNLMHLALSCIGNFNGGHALIRSLRPIKFETDKVFKENFDHTEGNVNCLFRYSKEGYLENHVKGRYSVSREEQVEKIAERAKIYVEYYKNNK